jgi:hypothetical protein
MDILNGVYQSIVTKGPLYVIFSYQYNQKFYDIN